VASGTDLSRIFKAYDVRGVYPDDLDEDVARRIGAAFAEWASAPSLLLGWDCRLSSPALADAFTVLKRKNLIKKRPLIDYLAAISVGKVGGETMVDLAYAEDSLADVDMNLVMTGRGRFVEVQGTAEQVSFDKKDLDEFLDLGWKAIQELVSLQRDMIGALE